MQQNEGYLTMEDGVRLFYRKLGTGPQTLVVLNGFFLFDDFKYLGDGRTVIFLDLRHRGRSDFVTDGSKLKRGVRQDADDVEAVRLQFGLSRIDLLAHSYAGIICMLYAMKYPDHVERVVQIGSMPPNRRAQYPPHLMNADATLQEFFANVEELQKERQSSNPTEFCRKFWTLLRVIYVANPADVDKIKHWEHCDLPTELNLMRYWMENFPRFSARSRHFSAAGGRRRLEKLSRPPSDYR